ncbi:hypothetical protein [Anaplasma phagocytophilum]|uniref:Uncharacterized protein n=2 Tax=Anaplasma phagocytophilum TaxID=948 RepID=S6G8G5_ANAPH|nr:hypothetical protein [Anaplasma phagocytophilum]EOA62600.1 hypothetical protein CRT38_05032 [Anaplasma phagocytophilum str. CRT38]KDB56801.1 hypothetical protein P030_06545 [Anaplasma phagocytophilum str. CRT35]
MYAAGGLVLRMRGLAVYVYNASQSSYTILHNVADASRLLCCGAVLSRIVQVILMLENGVSGMQYMRGFACAAYVV